MITIVKGLFLGGGQSLRMGSDKALLAYTGEPEIRRWKAIFDALELPFYWSVRPGQYPSDQFPNIPRIEDDTPGAGPLAAVVRAHKVCPDGAWLVLACDWPLLLADDVQKLLQSRRMGKGATAFVMDGRREPLFTVYEPAFLRAAAEALSRGENSLNRLLATADVQEVQPLDSGRFLNANDAISRHQASQSLLHRSDH